MKQHKCPKCYKKVGRYRESNYQFKCPKCWHIWNMTNHEASEYHLQDSKNEIEYQRKHGLMDEDLPF